MGSIEHTLKISWSTSLAYNKFRGVNKNIMNSYQNNREQSLPLLSTQTT